MARISIADAQTLIDEAREDEVVLADDEAEYLDALHDLWDMEWLERQEDRYTDYEEDASHYEDDYDPNDWFGWNDQMYYD